MSARLTAAQKVYREERDRAAKRRRERMAPIMRAAKKELAAQIEAHRPKKGRPRKMPFLAVRRDPLDL